MTALFSALAAAATVFVATAAWHVAVLAVVAMTSSEFVAVVVVVVLSLACFGDRNRHVTTTALRARQILNRHRPTRNLFIHKPIKSDFRPSKKQIQ